MSTGTVIFSAGAIIFVVTAVFFLISSVGGKREKAKLEEMLKKKY